ncbi:unnamed protein product, partial [Rotaria sp. Silwood2]
HRELNEKNSLSIVSQSYALAVSTSSGCPHNNTGTDT